ncbi:MAG: TonB-dependent receptor, partial [Acidobacteriaceae bacterium]|nr:TonB-dependent receptor [Acidobacteriaceae bacterium]
TATAYFGPYGSINVTERKTADYQGTFIHRGGSLVFGYSFQDQSGFISGTNASRTHNGIFVNEQYKIGNRIFLNGGVRLEHSSAFGTYAAPRGGGSVVLVRNRAALSSLFLRLSAGRGILEPSLYENYVQTPFAVGNPSLKPEKTNSYEAAVVAEWFEHRVRTQVAAFRSSFQNLIAYVYPSWENIEQSWARGVEFSTEAKVLPNVSVMASYTRLYTRIVNSVTPTSPVTGIGQELLRRPRNGGAIVVTAAPRRFTFAAGARFVGDRQDSDYAFGVTRNPGYENVFLSASYSLTKHFTPVIRLDNLLNERYADTLGYTALSRSILGGLRIGW